MKSKAIKRAAPKKMTAKQDAAFDKTEKKGKK
jgi:hypothetical protein